MSGVHENYLDFFQASVVVDSFVEGNRMIWLFLTYWYYLRSLFKNRIAPISLKLIGFRSE